MNEHYNEALNDLNRRLSALEEENRELKERVEMLEHQIVAHEYEAL